MAINISGFFDELKVALTAIETDHSGRLATSASIDAVYAALPSDAITLNGHQSLLGAQRSSTNNTAVARALATRMANRLLRIVNDDNQPADTTEEAALELIRQMIAASETVARPVLNLTPVHPVDGPVLVASGFNADGTQREHMIPDFMAGEATSPTSLTLAGTPELTEQLGANWPQGNGLTVGLGLSASLLTGYELDTDNDRPDTPDGWIVEDGQIGTTIKMTGSEVQTVTISGTPTSGHYTLKWVDVNGDQQTTRPIDYNADGGTVQSRLRELTGLEGATVTTTGTSPDFQHTVDFQLAQPPGDQPLLVESNNFDTGSIVIAQVTAGEPAYTGRAVILISNGAEKTRLMVRCDQQLAPSTQYACAVQLLRSAGVTSGQLDLSLIDGAYALTQDGEGTDNQASVSLGGISATRFEPFKFVFRTPPDLPELLYFDILLQTPHDAGQSVYVDQVMMAAMTDLGPTGPALGLLPGPRDLLSTDRYELTIANDRSGRLQDWFGRIWELQLPSDVSGSETISDT